jgi:uncharacterized spore protein YtfJ
MNVSEVLGQARDAISVQRVFGDPIEKNGVMVIPVARVMGGAGGGDGAREPEAEAGAAGETVQGGAAAAPSGIGFGVMAGPAGAYVIKGDQVRWEPAVSIERMTVIVGSFAVMALLILRSMLRIVVHR